MKIKYSDRVKQMLSKENIGEIALLSFSIIPIPKKQRFAFVKQSPTQTCILHYSSYDTSDTPIKIIINRLLLVDEDIMVLRTQDAIYMFTQSEA